MKLANSCKSKMADNEQEFPFPTLSSNVTEEEKTLSLKEKVNLIDNEIRQLYEFCTKAGYTQPQIEQRAQPLISLQSRERHIKWLRRLFSFAILVAVIAFLFAYDPAYRQICIYGKFIAMKVKYINIYKLKLRDFFNLFGRLNFLELSLSLFFF